MKLELPGQQHLPAMPEVPPKPAAKPLPVQLPCDLGLFSDDANQLDLIDMFMEPEDD